MLVIKGGRKQQGCTEPETGYIYKKTTKKQINPYQHVHRFFFFLKARGGEEGVP